MANTNLRLIMTGLDAQDRSVWVSDGPAQTADGGIGRPGVIYQIPTVPGNVRSDYSPKSIVGFPGAGGVYYRIVEFPPESVYSDHPELLPKGSDGKPLDVTDRNYGMHATNTIDILTVISGEVWSFQDDEPEGKLLKQGDTIILRGSMHSWHNKGDKPCVMSCVNVNATGGIAISMGPSGVLPRQAHT